MKKIILSTNISTKVFVCDERGEFENILDKIQNADYIQNAKKNVSLDIAMRLFSPHVVFVDELFYDFDTKLLSKAKSAGIKIYASFHGRDINDFIDSDVYKKHLFDRYVILSERQGKGTIDHILDDNFEEIKILGV